ncbi:DUF3696 domain-containing protein [uncultured Streptococcus sp.]|uniref:DUF3696 domain-containing protein n=1 Tax=uncultured Streptococcus sp. TaxID=83427 RepID=UPI003211BD3D
MMKRLNKIYLKNFKCYSEIEFDLDNLNVLTGVNSSGKSTLIQSLLLLRQSNDSREIDRGLLLNSTLVDLGSAQDIRCLNGTDGISSVEISIEVGTERKSYCCLDIEPESDFLKIETSDVDLNNCNLFTDGFNYISSDRIGPQKFYDKSYSIVKNRRSVGQHGEFFAHMYQLNKYENTILGDTLENDLEKWLSEISPGFSISTLSDSTSQTINLSFVKERQNFKSINVGFGLSYIAPVLTTLLMAKEGDLVIIESPEAHLHPKGQRKMGELLSEISSKGVQIITETHSDHIVNGVRLAVKNKKISRETVKFMYFYREGKEHKVEYVDVKDDGQLSHWPDGFFDEWDNALFELLRRD